MSKSPAEVIAPIIDGLVVNHPELTAARILAALAENGWSLVRQAVTIRYCTLHQSEAADSEDPRVCWLYDGIDDCDFVLHRLVPVVEGEK